MSESVPAAGRDPQALKVGDILKDGVIAGLAGAFVVAVVYGAVDILAGEPLRTPSALGALFAYGPDAARNVGTDLSLAARFTGLHTIAWVLLGTAGSAVISWVDSRPRLASVAFASFAFIFISVSYVVGAFSVEGLPPLHMWVGTLLGSATAAAYLAWRHPQLVRHIEREHLTETTRSEIQRALLLEARGSRAFEDAASRFPGSPFTAIAEEKRGHVTILSTLAGELGLELPQANEAAWQAEDLDGSLHAALAHEREVVDLYDRFLAVVPEMRIREVFLRLRYHAEDDTIRHLEEALDTTG